MSAADSRGSTFKLVTGLDTPDRGKDRLLVTAIDLFYKVGFRDVSIEQVCDEAGMSREEFNQHFRDKDDLVVEAIIQHDQWEREAWARAVAEIAGDNPRRQLLAVFDLMDSLFRNPDYRGCLFIQAAGEYLDPESRPFQAAKTHKRNTHAWVSELAARAGIGDPNWFADEYLAIFEGALILRQVHHHEDAVRVTKPMIERLLESHLAEAG